MNLLSNIDCATGFQDVPDESVDVIFTDPPYPYEFIDCYQILADNAARVLKPSGFLATYSGQAHFAEVVSRLSSSGLRWFWLVGQLQPSSECAIHQRNICSLWKPILIFQKEPTTKLRRQLIDLVGGKWLPKKHPWEQSLMVTIRILDSLAGPGAVVCDPFTGTGTNLLAAKLLQMRYIGFEINADTYAIAVRKLEQEPIAGRAIAELEATG